MSESTSQQKFDDEIRKVVSYFRSEFDLTFGEAVGSLFILATELANEASEDDEDEGEGEDEDEGEET